MKEFYEKHYKKLFIIPLLLIVLALVQLGFQYSSTGAFVNKGVSLSGGTGIDIARTADIGALQLLLNDQLPDQDNLVRSRTARGKQTGIIIESAAMSEQEIAQVLAVTKTLIPDLDIKTDVRSNPIDANVAKGFFLDIVISVLIAFFFMGLVVFIYFRTLVPSAAVVLAAASDILITLAIFNLTGIKLSLGGSVAFLMLIGYSVDSDIMLTTRLLKNREGSLYDRTKSAFVTGMTMSITTLTALSVSLVVIELTVLKTSVFKQIMLILFIGLLVDIVMTWLQNLAILRRYMEKKRV